MKEVCFLLCGEAIVRISMGSASAIPDSEARWKTIWTHRDQITEIVHTHPGGMLRFSQEDLTTMEAVEAALGGSLQWSIVTEDRFMTRLDGEDRNRDDEPWWFRVVRQISFVSAKGGTATTEKGDKHVRTD